MADEQILPREPTGFAQIDLNNIDDLVRLEVVTDGCARALLSPASSAVYWLAALPIMADFAREFLRQADKYIEGSCDLLRLPSGWGQHEAPEQLALFVSDAAGKVPAEPFAAIALRDAAEELVLILKSVNVPSLSGLEQLFKVFQQRLRRLAVDAGAHEAHEERAHRLLSAGRELVARLKRSGLYHEHWTWLRERAVRAYGPDWGLELWEREIMSWRPVLRPTSISAGSVLLMLSTGDMDDD